MTRNSAANDSEFKRLPASLQLHSDESPIMVTRPGIHTDAGFGPAIARKLKR